MRSLLRLKKFSFTFFLKENLVFHCLGFAVIFRHPYFYQFNTFSFFQPVLVTLGLEATVTTLTMSFSSEFSPSSRRRILKWPPGMLKASSWDPHRWSGAAPRRQRLSTSWTLPRRKWIEIMLSVFKKCSQLDIDRFWNSRYLCHFSTELDEIWSPGTSKRCLDTQ